MRYLIYDVAAESGGALSVLNGFYEKAICDLNNDYIFVVGRVELKECRNVSVLHLQWVKNSWLHRLFCDLFIIKRIISKNKVDSVLSLQNIGVKTKAEQTVYVHNAIPFAEYKFSIFKDTFLWFYQKVIGRITISSLKKVNKIIVQTNWMKHAVAKKCKIPLDNIIVERIEISKPVSTNRIKSNNVIFFYPATSFSFKNHWVLLLSCKHLFEKFKNFEFVFTIDSSDKKFSKQTSFIMKNGLPVKMVGRLSKDEVESYYQKSILVFPSLLETVGLPLIEAQQYNCQIVCSNLLFARDAIGDYKNAFFFNPKDHLSLSRILTFFLKEN